MLMPLHHVSFRGRGSLVGPRSVRYFSVAAPTSADALRVVEARLGAVAGEYTIARTELEAAGPRIVSESHLAA
jgi:hypothetical protein